MKIDLGVVARAGGQYDTFQIVRPDGSVRLELPAFSNLITDEGLDMIGELTSQKQTHLKLGTGTTAPEFTDTELENQVMNYSNPNSSMNTSRGYYSSPPYGGYFVRSWLTDPFSSPQILGEIGVGSSNRLLSRTLIKDSEGEPTTVEVLEGERIRASHRLNYWAPVDDITGTTVLDIEGAPVEHNWVSRAANTMSSISTAPVWDITNDSFLRIPSGSSLFGIFSGDLGPVTNRPSGTRVAILGPTVSNADYEKGSFSQTSSITMGPTIGNVSGGARSFCYVHGIGSYQIQFDPPIPKDNTKTLVLELSHSWGRAE